MPTRALALLMAIALAFSLAVSAAAKSEYTVSQADKDYLAGTGVLRVSAVPEQSPLLGFDEASAEITGATGDMLRYITERTGLKTEIVPVGGADEIPSLVRENKVDIVLNFPHDQNAAAQYGLRITEPYCSFRTMLVRRAGEDEGEDDLLRRTVARPAVYSFEGNGEYFDAVYHNDVSGCVKAVNDGRVDYCRVPEYCSVLFSGSKKYKKIELILQDDPVVGVCIGVSPLADQRTTAIVERTVAGMPGYIMESGMLRAIERTRLKLAAADATSGLHVKRLMLFVCVGALMVAAWLVCVTIRSNRRIAMSNKRYTLLTDLANEFTFDYDYKSRMFTFSDKCAKAFGCPTQLKNENTVLCRYGQGTMPRKLSELLQSGAVRRESTRECEMIMVGGERRWFRVICATLRDDREKTLLAVGKIFDVQSQIQERAELLQRSQIDGLTGIYNAAASRELIEKAIKARAGRGGGAMWIIDVDRFKTINDTLGHDVGDDTLRSFADTLNSHFRQRDIVGRLGGDEFIVWMADGVTTEVMRGRCESLCEKVRAIDPAGAAEHGIKVSISVGVAILDGGDSFESIYKRADKALYRAKEKRDGYIIV